MMIVVARSRAVMREAGDDAVMPKYREWRPRTKRKRRGEWTEREVCSGYVFLPASRSDGSDWSTVVVGRALRLAGSEILFEISESEVEALSVYAGGQFSDADGGPIPQFSTGDSVWIDGGPMDGWSAVVEAVHEYSLVIRTEGANLPLTISTSSVKK